MKIFNWVQRRFNQGSLKDGLARSVKKLESMATNDVDKQALLKQVALVNVLDGWKDGILTIGTLGFDPLKPFTQQNEYLILESEEEIEESEEKEDEKEQHFVDDETDDEVCDNAEDEEMNPLMLTTFDRYSFEGINIGQNFDENAINSEVMMMTADGVTDDQKKRKGERITLAELFLADSDSEMKKKPDSGEFEPNPGKTPVVRAKNSLSFAKKLIPQVRDDLRPIKTLHQVMRKMLKRKIHPELEGNKGNIMDNLEKPETTEDPSIMANESTESASLLRTVPGPAI